MIISDSGFEERLTKPKMLLISDKLENNLIPVFWKRTLTLNKIYFCWKLVQNLIVAMYKKPNKKTLKSGMLVRRSVISKQRN